MSRKLVEASRKFEAEIARQRKQRDEELRQDAEAQQVSMREAEAKHQEIQQAIGEHTNHNNNNNSDSSNSHTATHLPGILLTTATNAEMERQRLEQETQSVRQAQVMQRKTEQALITATNELGNITVVMLLL